MPQPILATRAAALASSPAYAAHTGVIAFESGHANPVLLPNLTTHARRALNEYRSETLQYAVRPGLPELREWIAATMSDDGAQVASDEILITNGAKHAIDLICRLLLDEGDSIVVTAPTYFTAIPIFRSFGVTFIEVGQDGDGMDATELQATLERLRSNALPLPKLIYDVPDFHNPTGLTMSLARRRAIVDIASEYGVAIVEDSPYRRIRFEGEDLPSLKSLDSSGIVFHVGTFSKLIAPGLRVGWVATTREMIGRLIQLKSDGGTCPLTQRLIIEFCTGGDVVRHTARVCATYRSLRDHMVTALHRELASATTAVPQGGYYLWVRLPDGIDGTAVARLAADAGVLVLNGARCYARPDAGHPRDLVRLAFSHATSAEIDEGVRLLAAAVDAANLRGSTRQQVNGR